MARPEAEVDGSTLEGAFALELRAERDRAGLDYRAMEKIVHFAPSTLSKAASGKGVPSLDVTLAYITACGGDQEIWRDKWHELRAATRRRHRPVSSAFMPQAGHCRTEQDTSSERVGQPGGGPESMIIPTQAADEPVSSQSVGAETRDPEVTERIPRPSLPMTGDRDVSGSPEQETRRSSGRHRLPVEGAPVWIYYATFAVVVVLLCSFTLWMGVKVPGSTKDGTAQIPQALVPVVGSVQPFEITDIERTDLSLIAGETTGSVTLRNPNSSSLVVVELDAKAELDTQAELSAQAGLGVQANIVSSDSISTSQRCSSDFLRITFEAEMPYPVKPQEVKKIVFTFTVSPDITPSCEGVKFRINYSGSGLQGTDIEGKMITS